MNERTLLQDIYLIIKNFRSRVHKVQKPAYLYMGNKERNELFMSAEFRLQNTALTPSKPWTIFGIEIVEVNKDSFLEVGEKNEIR